MPKRAGSLRPITDLLPIEKVPEAVAPLVEKSGDFLAFTHAEIAHVLGGRLFRVTIAIRAGYPIRLPGVDGIALIIGDQFAGWLLVPLEFRIEKPSFAIHDLKLRLRIDTDWLRPAQLIPAQGGRPARVLPKENGDPLEIEIGALSVIVDDHGKVGIDFDWELDLPLCTIGETGLGIEAAQVRYYGKDDEPPPTQPAGWKGLYLQKAIVYMPEFLAKAIPTLTATDCYIGTGGFTGRVAGAWNATLQGNQFVGQGSGDLFGIPFAVDEIALALRQGAFEESSIRGRVILPFFDEVVEVEMSLDAEGKITVALSSQGALKEVTKAGLLKMRLDSIRFEIDDGVLTIKLSGKITPLVLADQGLKWPAFDIDELSIDTEGHLSVTGGWIDLPQGYTLNLYAFKLEITKFGAGRDDNGNQYIGFNGGLDLIKGIPAGASVEGLRITWSDKIWPPQVSLKRVGVELTIPDKLHFKGDVSYEDLGDLKAFTGAITLELPAVNGLAIDGKIVFGSTPDPVTGNRFKYFAIYLEGEFGTGVPLWTSGLALTGIAGLFSVNYAPDKPQDWAWYSMDKSKSWFHKAPAGVTDILNKWKPESGTLAIGAGASISTYADGGHLFNGKFLLLLIFPGPVFLIEGRGSFLEKPSAEKEPLFHALAVLDVKAGYFLIGLDAKWKYDKEQGKLVEIAGSAETYFDFNKPDGWHIHIGKRDPMEQRIRASFATGLQANAYFMLDPRRLKLGVWIGKKDQYRFGPVRADLEAWLDANATLSFRPPHLSVAIWLHGLLGVKVWKWGFAIGLDARLEADVARPFHILGSLAIRIETRFKDFEFQIRLEWGPQVVRPEIPGAFRESGIAHPKSTVEWQLLVDGGSADPGPTVALDSRPYLMFEQPVHDATGISVNPAPDPGWILVGNREANRGAARVRYELKSIALERAGANGGWEAYPHRLYGAWAAAPPNPDNGGTQNRFMVYAKTPFALTDGTESWNPWAASNLPSYPCPVVANEKVCVGWEDREVGTTVPSPWSDGRHPDIQVSWSGGPRSVAGLNRALDGQQHGISIEPPPILRGWPVYVTNEADNTVSVIDTASNTVVGPPIPVGKKPFTMAITRDGSRLLVANAEDATVSVIDTAAAAVLGVPIPVPKDPRGIAVTPDGRKAYVTSAATRMVSVIDVAARKMIREILVPEVSFAIAILPSGAKAYVTHLPTSSLSVIDLATDTVVGAPLPGVWGAWRIVAAPNGSRVYIPCTGPKSVAVLDTATDRLVGTAIPVGGFARDLAISADGSRLYVANGYDDNVSIIDAFSHQILASIPVGVRPLSIAITPDGSRVYVANTFGHTVSVIDIATRTVVGAPIPVGGTPQCIAILPAMPVAQSLAAPQARDTSDPGTEMIPQVVIGGEPPVGSVEVSVTPGTAVVELLFQPSPGRPTGRVVDPPGFETVEVSSSGFVLRLDAAALGIRGGIRRILAGSKERWILARVCTERPALDGGLADLTKLHDELADGLSVWGEPETVLEPFTSYRLSATVERTIVGIGGLSGWQQKDTFNHTRRFQTDGPPSIGKLSKNPIELADLTRYVEQTIPTTLAPVGQRPELQKPVFRGYDVGVLFNEDYVDRMYTLAGRDLAIRLHDTSDEPVRDAGGGLIVFANRWGDADTVTLTKTNRRWLEMLNAASCLPRDIHDIDVTTLPRDKKLETPEHVLDPDTLYEARLVPLLWRALLPGAAPLESKDWTDVVIQVVVRPLPAGLTGVAFRAGASGRYVFSIDAQLGKRSLTGLSGPNRESSFAYDSTRTYQLSIEATGKRLRIEQDGELVFDVEDASRPSGSLSLFPLASATVQPFRDLSVHDFRKGAPVAYRFPFTTSKYVDFFHQIHSFQDEAWGGVLPPGTDLGALLEQAEDLSVPVPEKEARAYEALADLLLGAAARQLPARLEVLRVEGSAAPVLLVRGDEPIDWRRTTLAVSLSAVPPAAVAPGLLKLTDAVFGPMFGEERVTVLLRDALDPTGHRIEVRLPPGPLAPLAPEAAEPALLADRFAQGDLAGWTLLDQLPTVPLPQSSSWAIEDGELRLGNLVAVGGDPAFPGTLAVAGDSQWTDVAVTARLRSPGGGTIGMLFRGANLQSYYRFSMDSGQGYRQLVKSVAGSVTVLWRDDTGYDPERRYELTLVAIGPSLRGYLDGVPLFAVEDGDVPSGRIALYTWGNESAYFSGVRVDPAARVSRDWLLEESFLATPSAGWSFEKDGKASPPWEVGEGGMLAPPDEASALGAGLNGNVHALAVDGSGLYAAGAFTKAGGQDAQKVAHWDGTAWSPLGAGLDGPALALAVVGDEVYAGGQFTQAGGAPAANVAVWNRGTRSWTPLGSGVNGMVLALTARGNELYVGGRFTTAGGITVNRIARWNVKTRTWAALGSGCNSRVNAIAVVGQTVYAAGAFTSAGGGPANRVASWNGTRWSALGVGVDGEVLALAAAGSELWAGGFFTQAGGAPASRIARWNGGAWSAAGAGTDGPVRSLASTGEYLYAAGDFLAAGGVPAGRLARWDGSRGAWSGIAAGAGGTDGVVRALALASGTVYLGGDFSTAGKAVATKIARLEVWRLRTALAGDPAWGDYRISALWSPGGEGRTELLFRYQAPDRCYTFDLDAEGGWMRLIKSAGGKARVLWEEPWAASAGREALVTIDCLGESLAGYWNGERLFQVMDTELPAAGRVGLRVRGETGTRLRELRVASPVWTLWYAFEQERLRAAGTRFEVHGGDAVPAAPPPEPGVVRTFSGRRPSLPAEGMDLRLVAPGGTVEHARRFLPFEAYVPIPAGLMRKADGTGFFLLPDHGSLFETSSYRLTFTYERDKPGVSPVLSRAGSRKEERVEIDAPWSTKSGV